MVDTKTDKTTDTVADTMVVTQEVWSQVFNSIISASLIAVVLYKNFFCKPKAAPGTKDQQLGTREGGVAQQAAENQFQRESQRSPRWEQPYKRKTRGRRIC